jgi:predicted transcriptional regulator
MEVANAEEYTQALGQVAAGAWRQIALAERLGVPDALGMTTREWVEQRLGGYVQLSIPVRQEAALELVAEGMTKTQAGDVLGVSRDTVRRDVKRADARPSGDESGTEAECSESNGASARPKKEALKKRIARLDDDLAERVRGGLSIDEAESVAAERSERVASWVEKVREALSVLSRMAGSPIPQEFEEALTDPEREALTAVLDVIPKGVGE